MRVIGIVGPTASGKSAVGFDLVNHNCVVINADSRQVYKGFDALCAMPENLHQHQLYAFLHVEESVTVIQWAALAMQEIKLALQQGLIPVLIGGTGLYFKVLLEGIANLPKISSDTKKIVEKYSLEQLKEIVRQGSMDGRFHDRRRLEKAAGLWLQTGMSLDQLYALNYEKFLPDDVHFELYAIMPERDVLAERIACRLDAVFDQMVVEVAAAKNILNMIGFKEIAHGLETNNLLQAKEQVLFKTRQYAKRQKTFIRNCLQNCLKPDAIFEDADALLARLRSSLS